MKTFGRFLVRFALSFVLVSVVSFPVLSSTSATITGRVTDSQGLVVPGAQVQATNILTNISYNGETNQDGLYRISNLPPGEYRVIVQKDGFASIAKPGVELHVQDIITLNFAMQVGSVTQTITVEAGTPLINTESATVSTVIDRQFVGNLPLNGRSFQTLIQLTPGVVLTTASVQNPGQFSVNGQRSSANYFTVDGVSANIGVSVTTTLTEQAAGATPGFSATGGTNNLVSVDALEEFRIQTSTFAPEFGRTPGAQVSIVTRSGTNELHGTLFEYFRNDVLDANDWFANRSGLPKARLRQNIFGGTFSGPVVLPWYDGRNRTFFFLSYEGQRLRLPQTGITTVPSVSTRQSASAAIRPFLDAYPLPNGLDLPNGQAEFNATFSDASALDATSIRIDHRLTNRLNLFGRYSFAPSDLQRRGVGGAASLSTFGLSEIGTQTLTVGSTWSASANLSNEFRFNFSRNTGENQLEVDDFGGATVPPDSVLFPPPFSRRDSQFTFSVLGLQRGVWTLGRNASNVQRQVNFVDNLLLQRGAHTFKLGGDYRLLFPRFGPQDYLLTAGFFGVPQVLAGTPFFSLIASGQPGIAHFHDLGLYAQDTWRAHSRLTLTYGARWEIEPPPSAGKNPGLLAVTGIDNPATLALAPPGTPLWKTRYGNVAPRVGAAYQFLTRKHYESVLRGGFGIFYDLATQEVGTAFALGIPPFSISELRFSGLTFPFPPALTQPPVLSPLPSTLLNLISADPELKLPYVLQWNVTLDQGLGSNQTISFGYVAGVGRRLIMTETLILPNPNFVGVSLFRNGATSDYHALQIQFQRRMSGGLQALTSYTWSHSIDSGSTSSAGGGNSVFGRALDPNVNRGPSDFDVRHSFSAAVSYDIPAPRGNSIMRAAFGGWSMDQIIQARTATPVIVFDPRFRFAGFSAVVRPDVIPGVPLYLIDPNFAGGKRINPAALQTPPRDPVTGEVLRQGTLSRNSLQGFGAAQWDFAVRRQFAFSERWKLQFRGELFNVLNHPNFGNPEGNFSSPLFGQSTQMLGRSLGGGSTGGVGFAPLFQVGGPRSVQLSLKLSF